MHNNFVHNKIVHNKAVHNNSVSKLGIPERTTFVDMEFREIDRFGRKTRREFDKSGQENSGEMLFW